MPISLFYEINGIRSYKTKGRAMDLAWQRHGAKALNSLCGVTHRIAFSFHVQWGRRQTRQVGGGTEEVGCSNGLWQTNVAGGFNILGRKINSLLLWSCLHILQSCPNEKGHAVKSLQGGTSSVTHETSPGTISEMAQKWMNRVNWWREIFPHPMNNHGSPKWGMI